jgi:hypothetical protein
VKRSQIFVKSEIAVLGEVKRLGEGDAWTRSCKRAPPPRPYPQHKHDQQCTTTREISMILEAPQSVLVLILSSFSTFQCVVLHELHATRDVDCFTDTFRGHARAWWSSNATKALQTVPISPHIGQSGCPRTYKHVFGS